MSRFSVRNFLCHSIENLVREHFCVSQNFWYRKNLSTREGGGEEGVIKIFLAFFFLAPKNFVAEPFSVLLISSNEKCLG